MAMLPRGTRAQIRAAILEARQSLAALERLVDDGAAPFRLRDYANDVCGWMGHVRGGITEGERLLAEGRDGN